MDVHPPRSARWPSAPDRLSPTGYTQADPGGERSAQGYEGARRRDRCAARDRLRGRGSCSRPAERHGRRRHWSRRHTDRLGDPVPPHQPQQRAPPRSCGLDDERRVRRGVQLRDGPKLPSASCGYVDAQGDTYLGGERRPGFRRGTDQIIGNRVAELAYQRSRFVRRLVPLSSALSLAGPSLGLTTEPHKATSHAGYGCRTHRSSAVRCSATVRPWDPAELEASIEESTVDAYGAGNRQHVARIPQYACGYG